MRAHAERLVQGLHSATVDSAAKFECLQPTCTVVREDCSRRVVERPGTACRRCATRLCKQLVEWPQFLRRSGYNSTIVEVGTSMATLGIRDAFAQYGAKLRNVQWSVSAWAPDGSLVVSMWSHHQRKPSPPGTLIFEGSANRWRGPGNAEFRENIDRAFSDGSTVRLVIAHTDEVAHVEAGEDASKVRKEFFTKEEVVGRVSEWDGDRYAITFTKP